MNKNVGFKLSQKESERANEWSQKESERDKETKGENEKERVCALKRIHVLKAVKAKKDDKNNETLKRVL